MSELITTGDPLDREILQFLERGREGKWTSVVSADFSQPEEEALGYLGFSAFSRIRLSIHAESQGESFSAECWAEGDRYQECISSRLVAFRPNWFHNNCWIGEHRMSFTPIAYRLTSQGIRAAEYLHNGGEPEHILRTIKTVWPSPKVQFTNVGTGSAGNAAAQSNSSAIVNNQFSPTFNPQVHINIVQPESVAPEAEAEVPTSGDGTEPDESAFVLASQLGWKDEFDTYRKFKTWLDDMPNDKNGVRRKKPTEKRLLVHCGDYRQRITEKNSKAFESLDEHVADLEARKMEARKRRK